MFKYKINQVTYMIASVIINIALCGVMSIFEFGSISFLGIFLFSAIYFNITKYIRKLSDRVYRSLQNLSGLHMLIILLLFFSVMFIAVLVTKASIYNTFVWLTLSCLSLCILIDIYNINKDVINNYLAITPNAFLIICSYLTNFILSLCAYTLISSHTLLKGLATVQILLYTSFLFIAFVTAGLGIGYVIGVQMDKILTNSLGARIITSIWAKKYIFSINNVYCLLYKMFGIGTKVEPSDNDQSCVIFPEKISFAEVVIAIIIATRVTYYITVQNPFILAPYASAFMTTIPYLATITVAIILLAIIYDANKAIRSPISLPNPVPAYSTKSPTILKPIINTNNIIKWLSCDMRGAA